jgi:DNA-binding CsgD family transcriptional regulator
MIFQDLNRIFLHSKNIQQLNQALHSYLKDLGITCYSFTYYSFRPDAVNRVKYDHSSEKLKAWHDYYIAQGYDDIDTTLETVYQEVLPVHWYIDQQIKEAKRPRERKMRVDSKTFGAEHGLTIPVHGPKDDFACLMVEQIRGENCLNKWQELQFELLEVAYLYYHYLRYLLLKLQPVEKKHELSKREMQCLSLIAQRRNLQDMAKIMHITPRTVNYHIQRINKRLGVRSKYQAAAKAIELGLLE